MPQSIPFSDLSNFSQEIAIDGLPYRFSFIWNERFSFWTMSILTRDLTKIISGIKLVLGYNLFDQYPGRGLPPGELYAVDMTESHEKINRTNILDDVQLIYIEESELDTV